MIFVGGFVVLDRLCVWILFENANLFEFVFYFKFMAEFGGMVLESKAWSVAHDALTTDIIL